MLKATALIPALAWLLAPCVAQAVEVTGTEPGSHPTPGRTAKAETTSPEKKAQPASSETDKPDGPAGKTGQQPAGLDVKAEIRKCEKLSSSDKTDRERLAALCLLDGQIARGWKIIRDLARLEKPSTAEESLGSAIRKLRAKLAGMPRRTANTPPKREEVVARLRLAMTALAMNSPAEALAALEPLRARDRADRLELQRLALSGLAAWSAGVKDKAEHNLESLLKKVVAGRRLALRSAALVDRVTCYGVYDERSRRTVRPGESVMAYVEVLNFQCNGMDTGGHLTALEVSLVFEEESEKKDRRGNPVKVRRVVRELPGFSRVRHRTRSPLRDLHLVIRFKVPPELQAGTKNHGKDKAHFVKIIVTDQGNVPAAVEGKERKPTPSASIRLPLRVAG